MEEVGKRSGMLGVIFTKAQKKRLKNGTFFDIELVESVTRFCAMNLLLHGIGGESDGSSHAELPVENKDALTGKHGEYELVLANPPFAKKSSVTIVNEADELSKESLIINRDELRLRRLFHVASGLQESAVARCTLGWHEQSGRRRD